jgi:hypothetical protein
LSKFKSQRTRLGNPFLSLFNKKIEKCAAGATKKKDRKLGLRKKDRSLGKGGDHWIIRTLGKKKEKKKLGGAAGATRCAPQAKFLKSDVFMTRKSYREKGDPSLRGKIWRNSTKFSKFHRCFEILTYQKP